MGFMGWVAANKAIVAIIGSVTLVAVILAIALPLALRDNGKRLTNGEIVARVLAEVPLIDGHNDFPYNLRLAVKNQLNRADLSKSLLGIPEWDNTGANHADIPRLRAGKVGAQFWAAYIGCQRQYNDSLHQALEQIDVVKRMVEAYPDDFEFVTTAQGIRDAFRRGKIGSLIGLEGGHMMEESLAALRIMHEVGVRYMTLTHNCDTPWSQFHVEPAGDESDGRVVEGLTEFGEQVIAEMNRLGMIIDLSHVHERTMKDALMATKAPVMFSHSSARAVCNASRNVPDDVLRLTRENRGIVMVNFFSAFVNCSINIDNGENAVIHDVVRHFNHMKEVMGVDYIGIGADYCGVPAVPIGLEDVSTYPVFLEALLEDEEGGWTEDDLRKIAGLNMLRVMEEVEQVSRELRATTAPSNALVPAEDMPAEIQCGPSELLEAFAQKRPPSVKELARLNAGGSCEDN